jgi:hypothetical protein
MQERGNGNVGDFGWVQSKILEGLIRDGFNLDFVESLREKIAAIEMHLQAFRATRQQLGDSGKYTPQGLVEAERELAAPVAGEIRRLMDAAHLKNNLVQKRAKLQPPATGDMADRIIAAFEVMEIRTLFQPMILLSNPQTGGVTVDTIKADQLYRDAMQRGDLRAMAALEGWPLGSPVSAELIAQGQQQRHEATNPLLAKEIRELETLHEQFQRITQDALAELPLPQDDPIAVIARGEIAGHPAISEGESH